MTHHRLLATDLDGTLFGHDLVISARTRTALARWTTSGRTLAIATGRMFRSTLPIARDLGVTTPVICYQGACIRCPVTEATTWHRPLAEPTARQAIAWLERAGFTVQLFQDDTLHVRGVTPATLAYLALSKVVPHDVGSWDEVFAQGPPTKVVAIAAEAAVAAEVDAMRAHFGATLSIVQSQPTFLEVTAAGVNKGVALAALAATLGIPMADVVAVGDGQNDVEMLQAAGLGVAMGNAHPAAQAVADRVTRPLAEDGVAALIEGLLA